MRRDSEIAVLIDAAAVPDKDPLFLNKSKSSTEYCVIQTLRLLGYKTDVIAVPNSIAALAARLKRRRPDLVFNLTEEFNGERRKDVAITRLLERLKIPFTGSSTKALALCRDKILSKQILKAHHIDVPDYFVFASEKNLALPGSVRFPLVVKPAFEDGSDGISNSSVVYNIQSLKKRIGLIIKKWHQPAIAEQYIPGREIYVSIIGNFCPTVLPLRECFFNNESANLPCIATYRIKWDSEYRRKQHISFGFARLRKSVAEKISQTCKKVYRLLQISDYGRIDLRLTSDNRIFVLEANANPDIKSGEDLAASAERFGLSYDELIQRIVSSALARFYHLYGRHHI